MDKFYITTPIYYVNAPPHLGHAITSAFADIIARYHRSLGKEVFFLTGTDEHGAKIVRSAEGSGREIEEFVTEVRESFKNLSHSLNLSNDDFIFTSDRERHWPGAQKLWQKIKEAGDIYKGRYKGLYCIGHEAFVTEKDLVEGKCADHDEKPQLIEEENYFFKLSKYTAEIKRRIESKELLILPEGRRNEILALLEEGLKDISFSRPRQDISWGIPVPGDESQTMYVWCDALSNYISALGYGSEDEAKFLKFWPADIHFIGKDILRFHAAIWPAMLLSAGLALPLAILANGLIQVGGRKMSKTLGNVVNPFDLVERHGTDAVRYYFSREVPVFSDGDFTEEKFLEAYTGNLVNGLGNYVERVSTMVKNYFGGIIEKPDEGIIAKVPMLKPSDLLQEFVDAPSKKLEYLSLPYFIEYAVLPRYKKAMEAYEINKAADVIFGLLKELDGYVQDYEPFKLIKTDREKTRAALWSLCLGGASLAWMLLPFLPESAEKILDIFGVRGQKSNEWSTFTIKEHKQLFPRKER
jgi:methionyl-tRNA synthetase